jgi:hypothetical protein
MADAHVIDDDSRLAALLRWRAQLIDSGAVAPSSFKEAHVRLVLRSGRTDVEQIRAMLPGAVAEHADEMARVLREAAGPASAPAATEVDDRTQLDSATPDLVPQSGFAPYTFGMSKHEVASLSLRRRGADTGTSRGALEVSWPPFVADGGDTAPYVVYRLVSTDGHRGYSPDNAHLVAATADTAVTDDRVLTEAVRHLQVWVNAGANVTEALATQPVLHAAGVVVCTLQDFEIREDAGRVIGQWAPVQGVSAVRVYRIPAGLAEHDGPAFRIATAGANLTGFVDHDAERGQRYKYRLRCEVEVDGVVRLSEAVECEVQISAIREPVTDLAVTMRGDRDGALFDLEWTMPRFGQVLIFRTPDSPSAGAHATELDESVLDQAGLNREAQLTHPVSERIDQHGVHKSVMSAVPWPEGWNRAYFTPVTVLDGRARLGKPISTVRTGLITDVALTEYCSKQVLTFDWPAGAASVMVYMAPKGHDPSDGLTGRSYEIALADYEKYGGMQFVDSLPNRGCSLHLVPAAFTGGRRVLGAPVSIEYGGLLRLWYDVAISRDPHGLPLSAAVRITAETEVTGSPPFVLVNNSERIPLSVNDGSAVDMVQIDAHGRPIGARCKEFQWSALTVANSGPNSEVWVGDVRGLQGWVRLFANLPPDRLRLLALLDPAVDTLRLTRGPIT